MNDIYVQTSIPREAWLEIQTKINSHVPKMKLKDYLRKVILASLDLQKKEGEKCQSK